MRGKVFDTLDNGVKDGITPAYAGKRNLNFNNVEVDGDHPRLCGEKRSNRNPTPRARGITPAYAGKRTAFAQVQSQIKDHPRLCGEKDSPLLNSTLILGSPPPMRGKALCTGQIKFGYRITPAYAGKSAFIVGTSCEKRDHPRLCGEKAKTTTLVTK